MAQKLIIIYAHPDVEGHAPEFLKEVKKHLEENSITHPLIDLYGIGYDPVLRDNELYTSGRREISSQNRKFQQMIAKADKLVFIYPVWWSTMPAILKGFIDRVFTAGFAFRFIKHWWFPLAIPHKLLKGKKAVVFTTSGSPWYVLRFYLMNRPVSIIRHDILGFFGIKAKVFLLGGATSLTEKHKAKAKRIVERGMRWLLR
ncbi:NAD(P)H-dependent oxidoreductase [Candidatus Woesearchaeota archaeon]|nr:NAD(P)H-dependent oxidoreductase [Candidatus Woesearchaeota archaeon]